MNRVRLYTIKECPYCTELKLSLNEMDIPFVEIDVNLPQHEAEFKTLMTKTGSDDVPVVVIDKKILAPNHSFTSIKQLINMVSDLYNS